LSPIAAFAATLNTGLYAQAYGNDWFEGGGFPPGQMRNTVQGAITQQQADEIRSRTVASIRDRRPLVTGSDWEYTPITVPPNEAQFIETMRLSATQVANIYGLPPEDVGGNRGNSLTYATVELNQLERQLALRPWLVVLESVFAAHLPDRQYVKFNADAIVRADMRTRWDTYQIARNIGVRSVDEIRALEDLPPLAGGEGADFTPLKGSGGMAQEQGSGGGGTVTDLTKRWVTPA
jgi:HK97 family phage portal protein